MKVKMKNEKIKKKYKRFFYFIFPFVFIILAWLVFSSPYFIQHRIPYPADFQVSFFTPWNNYHQYQIPAKNNSLSDVVNELYPWKHFSIETLKSGQIPYWNPYSFSGTPHLANFQTAIFSPFNILFFILPFVDAWSLLILLQPILAGLFMYLFLRELKVSVVGSLIGSISFMFCGFIVSWMAWGTMAMAIAFLPLCLFAIEKSFQKRSFIYFFLLSISISISFFSGHFQTSLYLAIYSAFYLVYKFILTKNLKAFLWLGGFYLLGILISLIQIVPTLEIYKLTTRSELFINSYGIPFYYLVTIFSPDFFGNPVTRNDWMSFYPEWASFIGIIPFTLALVSVFSSLSSRVAAKQSSGDRHAPLSGGRDDRIIAFFFFAGLLALLFAIDSPLQTVLATFKIPVFSSSIPSRIIVLFSFSFSVLAGFGLDYLRIKIEKKELKRLLVPFIAVGVFILLIWMFLLFVHFLPKDKLVLAIRNMILPSFIFFVAFSLIALTIVTRRKIFLRTILWTLIMFTLIDSLRFAMKWMPFEPQNLIFPAVPILTELQKDVGKGRVYGDFGAYVDTYFHIPSIEGYDPLYIKRYGEFLASAKTGDLRENQKSIVRLDRDGKYANRVLDLLGVTIIYSPMSFLNQPWAFPAWSYPSRYTVAYQDNDFQLYKNTTAFPRAKLFYNYEVLNTDKQIMERFYSDNFDYRNTLILQEQPGLDLSKNKGGYGKANILSYTPNKIIISVTTSTPALLFLSDSYFPLWAAKVNGTEGKIYRSDYAFRSVLVPQGKSTVEFYYKSLF